MALGSCSEIPGGSVDVSSHSSVSEFELMALLLPCCPLYGYKKTEWHCMWIMACESGRVCSSLVVTMSSSLDTAACSELTMNFDRYFSCRLQHERTLNHDICLHTVHVQCAGLSRVTPSCSRKARSVEPGILADENDFLTHILPSMCLARWTMLSVLKLS